MGVRDGLGWAGTARGLLITQRSQVQILPPNRGNVPLARVSVVRAEQSRAHRVSCHRGAGRAGQDRCYR